MQRIEHSLRGAQIRSRETLREAVVYGCHNLSRVVALILRCSQAGTAQGAPQFPKEGALFPGYVDRTDEAVLGRRNGPRRRFLNQQFSLDAKEFGNVPALCPAVSSRQRLVDGGEGFANLSQPGDALRQDTKVLGEATEPPGVRACVERRDH